MSPIYNYMPNFSEIKVKNTLKYVLKLTNKIKNLKTLIIIKKFERNLKLVPSPLNCRHLKHNMQFSWILSNTHRIPILPKLFQDTGKPCQIISCRKQNLDSKSNKEALLFPQQKENKDDL